jgi:peroxiredoxin
LIRRYLGDDALIDLANKHARLKEQNVRVIAVSGDKTEQAFKKKLAYHQWPDNYCDFTGMAGVNFKNYAVLGVPTLYLLHREGIVVEKSAMVDEVLDAVESSR